MLQPIYDQYAVIETRFPVDPALVTALADRALLSAAEGLALTAPYGDQTNGFEAGQLAMYAQAADNSTVVAIADNAAATVVRGVFADSLVNTLRTYGLRSVDSTATVLVSIYKSGNFKTDVRAAAVDAAAPSTLLFSDATGNLTTVDPGARAVALVDIAPNFSSDSMLYFELI